MNCIKCEGTNKLYTVCVLVVTALLLYTKTILEGFRLLVYNAVRFLYRPCGGVRHCLLTWQWAS